MTNNDILRRLRYTFNFNDQKMVGIFSLVDLVVSKEQVIGWLKKEEDPAHLKCNDQQLATFLNGLIIERRGKKDGPQPVPEKRLNNNIILTKLRIALSLKAEDIVEMMRTTNMLINKNELSAFSRQTDHKNYRECQSQFLRNFLMGVEKKFLVERPQKYISDKEHAESKLVAFDRNKKPAEFDRNKKPAEFDRNKKPVAFDRTKKPATAKPKQVYVNPNLKTEIEPKAKPALSSNVLKLTPNKKTD